MLNMGAVKGFDVFLDEPLEVYHSGETLRGHVMLTLTKDLAMKGKMASFFFPSLAAFLFLFHVHNYKRTCINL